MKLYHISSISNRDSILKNGLLCCHIKSPGTLEVCKNVGALSFNRDKCNFFFTTKPKPAIMFNCYEIDTNILPLGNCYVGEFMFIHEENYKNYRETLKTLADFLKDTKNVFRRPEILVPFDIPAKKLDLIF